MMITKLKHICIGKTHVFISRINSTRFESKTSLNRLSWLWCFHLSYIWNMCRGRREITPLCLADTTQFQNFNLILWGPSVFPAIPGCRCCRSNFVYSILSSTHISLSAYKCAYLLYSISWLLLKMPTYEFWWKHHDLYI